MRVIVEHIVVTVGLLGSRSASFPILILVADIIEDLRLVLELVID